VACERTSCELPGRRRITCCANPAALSRDLARRRGGGGSPPAGGARPDLRHRGTYRASSSSRSRSRTIIAATCTRTTSASSWLHREIGSRDSTCWWAAAWGATHGKTDTYPRLADTLGFAKTGEVREVAEAVVKVQRIHGNRSDRRHARLKYLLDKQGPGLVSRAGGAPDRSARRAPASVQVLGHRGHLGCNDQGKGRSSWACSSRNGRHPRRRGPPAAERAAPRGRDCWRRAFASRLSRTCLLTDIHEPAAAAGGPDPG